MTSHSVKTEILLMPRNLRDLPPDKAIVLTKLIGFTSVCARPPSQRVEQRSRRCPGNRQIDGLMAYGDKQPKIASSSVPGA